jgi:integrase/recombinase XerC
MDNSDYPSFFCHRGRVPYNPGPAAGPAPSPTGDASEAADADWFPDWFTQFLNDRQTRKPSAHTMKAYRQDFIAIAILLTDGDPARLTVPDITKDSMRQAFAAYARDHEAASIRRCWSTWNVLCTFLYTGEQLAANPMQLVGRPKLAKPPWVLPSVIIRYSSSRPDRYVAGAPS